jgi:hypothetical protein
MAFAGSGLGARCLGDMMGFVEEGALMKLSKLAAAALVLWPLCAHAAGDADAARQFGLIGIWAVDCSQPAGQHNPYETFSVAADGTIAQWLDMQVARTHDHLHDLKLRGHLLSVKWDSSNSGLTLDVALRTDHGKIQSWSSKKPDGTPIVRDGMSVINGNPMPVFEKCGRK